MSMKNSNDEPTTFRLLVQCLNQLRYQKRAPIYYKNTEKTKKKNLSWTIFLCSSKEMDSIKYETKLILKDNKLVSGFKHNNILFYFILKRWLKPEIILIILIVF